MTGLDKDKQARYLTNVANVSDELAAKLLVVYHLAEQKPMMSAFLDAPGGARGGGGGRSAAGRAARRAAPRSSGGT